MQVTPMDESVVSSKSDLLPGDVNGLIHDHGDCCNFHSRTNVESTSICSALKFYLKKYVTDGADMVFLDQKLSRRSSWISGIEKHGKLDWGSCSKEALQIKSAYEPRMTKDSGTLTRKERAKQKATSDVVEWKNDSSSGATKWNDEYVEVTRLVNCPSGGQTGSPFNVLVFFTLLLTKLVGLQFNFMVSLFTFPIWLAYFWFMFMIFPLQTLRHIRRSLVKKMTRWWCVTSRRVTAKAQKSVGSIAMRFGCALFWSSYVCLILLGLLASGFVVGGIVMRQLVVQPVHTSETLNFDYTRASPVAFVPIVPPSSTGDPYGPMVPQDSGEGEKIGAGVVPYNHRLQVTVSLIMPESDYNLKLGVFQVRLELVSARGKVTGSSAHPCILRFKSQPIRFMESVIRSAPLIAGYQSESQTLKVKMQEFTQGLEPTAYLKVVLEQRAEFKDGAGIPEIYAASVLVDSQLPQTKRLVWLWRRTILVWISIILFLTELMLALAICPNVVIPRGKPKLLRHPKAELHPNFTFPWYKRS